MLKPAPTRSASGLLDRELPDVQLAQPMKNDGSLARAGWRLEEGRFSSLQIAARITDVDQRTRV